MGLPGSDNMTSWQEGLVFFEVKDSIHQGFHSLGYNISFYIFIYPGIPLPPLKTMGVNITTIDYLRVLIIEIGEKP